MGRASKCNSDRRLRSASRPPRKVAAGSCRARIRPILRKMADSSCLGHCSFADSDRTSSRRRCHGSHPECSCDPLPRGARNRLRSGVRVDRPLVCRRQPTLGRSSFRRSTTRRLHRAASCSPRTPRREALRTPRPIGHRREANATSTTVSYNCQSTLPRFTPLALDIVVSTRTGVRCRNQGCYRVGTGETARAVEGQRIRARGAARDRFSIDSPRPPVH
jgi:hypothetical protein